MIAIMLFLIIVPIFITTKSHFRSSGIGPRTVFSVLQWCVQDRAEVGPNWLLFTLMKTGEYE